jgi:nucleoside-diphosphate-sugar epimerase
MNTSDKIVITGAAGLVGQNLATLLAEEGFTDVHALDRHEGNLAILRSLHPDIKTTVADLSKPGGWKETFAGAQRLFLLQAHITAQDWAPFQRDTIDSTREILRTAIEAKVPFTVFTGSSVVNSVADDNYTRSKKIQERMVQESGLPSCVVRPTLMFGWFDPKHLGWLSRFLAKTPVFPVPGDGRFLRQPLYARDFTRILLWCAREMPSGGVFDITGQEEITYVDIIRTIRRVKKLRTPIVHLPVPVFRALLRIYGAFSSNPPFVADQLDALMAGDHFIGEPFSTFGITPTPFAKAIEETFLDPRYSNIVTELWS